MQTKINIVASLHTCTQPPIPSSCPHPSELHTSMSRILHSLPAPVVHAGFSVSQSKSHVLAGVQDAYWSDDETVSVFVYFYMHSHEPWWLWDFQEDAECPLCLEEMDISDLNFKPCICGYQVSLTPSPRSCRLRSFFFCNSDLSILLASHQGEPQRALPCMQKGLHG